MVWWEAALPMVLHSSKNYHQELATEPPKDVATSWGAVIVRFHSPQVVICALQKPTYIVHRSFRYRVHVARI